LSFHALNVQEHAVPSVSHSEMCKCSQEHGIRAVTFCHPQLEEVMALAPSSSLPCG